MKEDVKKVTLDAYRTNLTESREIVEKRTKTDRSEELISTKLKLELLLKTIEDLQKKYSK